MDGHIEVRVGKVPGTLSDIALNGERTVNAALRTTGIAVGSGEQVNVNGTVTRDLESTLDDGDTVLVVRQIKGN